MNRSNQPTHQSSRWRTRLALLRLLLLFTLTCQLLYLAAYRVADFQSTAPNAFTVHYSPFTIHHSVPFLGINTQLAQYAPDDRHAALQRLHNAGFGWVRQRLDWGVLEPRPGRFDWTTSDAIIDAILTADLIPVIVLDGSPAWARAPQDLPPTDNPFAPPAEFADFARFVTTFAQRYGDRVDYYQLWDEPNIAPHWGNRLIDPVGYAQFLKVGATAIRNADPTATILSAALAPTRDRGHTAIDEVYYLQRLYAAGAADSFDVLAIQPFGFGHAPDDPRMRVDRLNFARAGLIRQTMVAAGDGAKPVWAVRYGWNRQADSPWGTVNAANQRRFAVEALSLAQEQWSWLTAMAWVIDQPHVAQSDSMWGFALTDELAGEFQAWGAEGDLAKAQRPQRTLVGAWYTMPLQEISPWLWVSIVTVLITWRAWAAARLLPWARWRVAYQGWRGWRQVSVWGLLLLIYYVATFPGLIVLCWIMAVVLLRRQPHVGLWLAAALLPFHAYHKELAIADWSVAVAPSHAILLCLALAQLIGSAIRLAFRGRATRNLVEQLTSGPSPERWYLTITRLALLWLVISLATAGNVWHWPAYAEGLWDLTLMPLLLYILTSLLITQSPITILHALFLGGVAVAMLGLWMWTQGTGTAVDNLLRLTGPYFSPNHTALYLERTLFVGLGLVVAGWQTKSGTTKWLLGGLVLVAIALLLTASRGAWLFGVPVGVVVFLWAGKISPRRCGILTARPEIKRQRAVRIPHLRLVGTVTLVILALGVMAIFTFLFWERLTNSATLLHRLTIWQSSLALWRDFVWFGVGPGGFFWRYPTYLPLGALDEPNLYHPHNLWLEFATGWGVLGLLWLSGLLWVLVRMLWGTRRGESPQQRWYAAGILAALAAGIGHAQVDAFFVLPDLALWFWLVLALLGAVRR